MPVSMFPGLAPLDSYEVSICQWWILPSGWLMQTAIDPGIPAWLLGCSGCNSEGIDFLSAILAVETIACTVLRWGGCRTKSWTRPCAQSWKRRKPRKQFESITLMFKKWFLQLNIDPVKSKIRALFTSWIKLECVSHRLLTTAGQVRWQRLPIWVWFSCFSWLEGNLRDSFACCGTLKDALSPSIPSY